MFKDKELLFLKMFVFFIPYNLGVGWIVGNRAIFASDIFLFLLLVSWFSKNPKFKSEISIVPATLMVVWGSISVIFAISQLLGGVAIFMLVKAYLCHFYIINRVTTRKKIRVVVDYLLIGIAIQGAIGIAQKLKGGPLGLARLGESMGVMVSDISRVVGTFWGPNRYGAYLILLLPLAISLFLFIRSKRYKYLYGCIIIIAMVSLFFSLSRSSWAGLIVSIFFMVLILARRGKISPKMLKAVLAVLIAIVVIGVMFWDIIEQRFERGADGTHRNTMLNVSYKILTDNPIFGVGLFNYQFHSYELFAFWHPVHNTFLRLACETGIPGLIFFLWFIFLCLREAYRGTKIKDKYLSAVALGCFGGQIAFLVAVNFGPQYQFYQLKLVFWILGALAVAIRRIRKIEIREQYRMKALKNNNENIQHKKRLYEEYITNN